MLKIRPIVEEEAELFAALGSEPAQTARMIELLNRTWEKGDSRPEWCFVAEEEGKVAARLMYWAAPDRPEEVKLMAVRLPWEGEWKRVGKALLEESMKEMQKGGAKELQAYLSSGGEGQAEHQKELYLDAGLKEVQSKKRFELNLAGHVAQLEYRLTYRNMEEVGEKAYLEAIRRVTEGTLDRLDILGIAEKGAENAARHYLEVLKNIDHKPTWWQLGYDGEGKLAGLVVPQKISPEIGVVNYIGVVPEARGKGLVHDLLARATEILKAEDMRKIIADTDCENYPAIGSLEKGGFQFARSIFLFRKSL